MQPSRQTGNPKLQTLNPKARRARETTNPKHQTPRAAREFPVASSQLPVRPGNRNRTAKTAQRTFVTCNPQPVTRNSLCVSVSWWWTSIPKPDIESHEDRMKRSVVPSHPSVSWPSCFRGSYVGFRAYLGSWVSEERLAVSRQRLNLRNLWMSLSEPSASSVQSAVVLRNPPSGRRSGSCNLCNLRNLWMSLSEPSASSA